MHTPFPIFGSRARLAAFATASLLVAAAACRTATSVNEGAPVHVAVDEPFQLRVGQRAELATDVAGRPFRVTLIEVTGDSRCPEDVRCVWEGDARVALRLELGSEAADTAAHTSGRFTPPPELAGHRVVVEALDPATHSGRTIPQSDYVATLRITESR